MKLSTSFLTRRMLPLIGICLLALAATLSGLLHQESNAAADGHKTPRPSKHRSQIPRRERQDATELTERFLRCTDPFQRARLGDNLVGVADAAAFQIYATALLAEQDDALRRELATCLDRVAGPEALTMAVSLLAATEDPIIVDAVVRTVGRMGDADTVDFLVELHGEQSNVPSQAENALNALAAIRNPEATPGLAMLLTPGHDRQLAGAVIAALSATGTPDAYGIFLEAFESMPASDYALRTEMLNEVTRARSPESRDFLESLSEDECAQPLFREAAREALAGMKAGEDIATQAPVIAGVMPAKGK